MTPNPVEQVVNPLEYGLPPLPADWSWVRFESVCERVSVGHVGPTKEYFTDKDQGVLFLRSQDVRPGRLVLETAASVTRLFHEKLKKSQLRSGDVLFVRVGANRGDCCVVPEDVGELNCANIVFARPHLPTGFHAYFFQSHLGRSLLLGASTGAAQGVINTSAIAQMPVPQPPVEVQRQVTAVLKAYDDLIENNTRRIQILEKMAQAIYREWFVNFRFPGHEKVKLVDSPMGRIPRGWLATHLGDVVQLAYGKALKAEHRSGGPYPVYGSSGVVGYHNEALVKAPGVILGRKGNVGSVHWSDEDFFPIDTVFFVKTSLLLEYVFYNLKQQTFSNSDAAVPGLNRHAAYLKSIVIPTEATLAAFGELVGPTLAAVRLLNLKNSNLRRTRDLLLPKLVSGAMDVSALTVESP